MKVTFSFIFLEQMKGFNNLLKDSSYLNKEKYVLSYFASDIKKNYDEYMLLEETANDVKNMNSIKEISEDSKISRGSIINTHREKTFGMISNISNINNLNIAERSKGPISNRMSLRSTMNVVSVIKGSGPGTSDKKLTIANTDGYKRRLSRGSTCKNF